MSALRTVHGYALVENAEGLVIVFKGLRPVVKFISLSSATSWAEVN